MQEQERIEKEQVEKAEWDKLNAQFPVSEESSVFDYKWWKMNERDKFPPLLGIEILHLKIFSISTYYTLIHCERKGDESPVGHNPTNINDFVSR